MKNFTRLFCLSLIFFAHTSSAQSWKWARCTNVFSGKPANSNGADIVADSHGNVYNLSNFVADSVHIGAFTVKGGIPLDTIDNNGVLAKYDSSGNVLWIKSMGHTLTVNSDYIAYHVTVDRYDNVYVAGVFSDSTLTIGNSILHRVGVSTNFFVVKLTPAGNVVWTYNNGGTFLGVDIKTDHKCNVYLGGDYTGTIRFGSDSLVNSQYSERNVLLVKLDSSGHYLWSRAPLASYHVNGTSICLDKNSNIYISGQYGGTVIFAHDTLRTSLLPTTYYDNFIMKWDSAGTPQWARSILIHDLQYSQVLTDSSGNLYTASTFSINGLNIGAFSLPASSLDLYIAKYTPSGNVIWAKKGGGSNLDYVRGMYLDPLGKIWISGGVLSSTVTIDTIQATCDVSTNGAAYLAELDSSGHALLFKSFRNGGYNVSSRITGDPYGNIYMAGAYLNGNCVIGNDTLPPALPHTTVLFDNYIAKLGYHRTTPYVYVNTVPDIDLNINIYPNPATREFIISTEGQASNAVVSIYNFAGQMLLTQKLNSNRTNFSCATFAPGIYICKVIMDGNQFFKKLVVQ